MYISVIVLRFGLGSVWCHAHPLGGATIAPGDVDVCEAVGERAQPVGAVLHALARQRRRSHQLLRGVRRCSRDVEEARVEADGSVAGDTTRQADVTQQATRVDAHDGRRQLVLHDGRRTAQGHDVSDSWVVVL